MDPVTGQTTAISASAIPKKIFLPVTIILLATVFVLIWSANYHTDHSTYWSLQVPWFIFLNSIFSAHPVFWSNMTQLGDSYVLIPLLSFLFFIKPRVFISFFAAIPVGFILAHAGKALTSIPRPAAVIDHSLFTIVGDTLAGQNSFPSGHTTTIFAAATIIALAFLPVSNRTLRLSMIITVVTVASIVALSRIAVGAHWPLDIVVGAAFGCLSGFSGFVMTERYTFWRRWANTSQYSVLSGFLLLVWSGSLAIHGLELQGDAPLMIWISFAFGIAASIYLLGISFFTVKQKLWRNII